MGESGKDAVLRAALEYAGYGWRVIALKGPRSKRPVIEAWQKAATTNEDTITRWWSEIPDRNVGVQMGKLSGIIDVECDAKSPEQLAELEKVVARIFGGELPYTPVFRSKRGKHWIVKWRDDLPFAETNAKFEIKMESGTIEFRTGGGGKGCQTVFPPSQHPDGPEYTWLVPPSQSDVSEIDDDTLTRIWTWLSEGGITEPDEHTSRPPEYWLKIGQGVDEGSRNCSQASYVGRLLADTKNPSDADAMERLWQNVQRWNNSCRPPQSIDALRRTFDSILNNERQNRLNEQHKHDLENDRQWSPQEGKFETEWKLEIVETKPRVYRLYSPLWGLKAPSGYIALTSAQMHSPSQIRVQALEQADVWISRQFDKTWSGDKEHKSLARQLTELATSIQAPLESNRELVLADLSWEWLSRARVLEDGKTPSPHQPSFLTNGSIAFKFSKLWNAISFDTDRFKRRELSTLIDELGGKDLMLGNGSDRRRFKELDREAVARLKQMINH